MYFYGCWTHSALYKSIKVGAILFDGLLSAKLYWIPNIPDSGPNFLPLFSVLSSNYNNYQFKFSEGLFLGIINSVF